MVYIKITENQLRSLRNLPTSLNTSQICHNIAGVMILNKAQEIRQIILDFQAYHMDELFSSHKNRRVQLSEHIKECDSRNNYTFTFEIENALKNSNSKGNFPCFSIPDIYQWIKCVLYSIYRNVYNHIIFTASGRIFIIAMKKKYFESLLRKKYIEKIKIKDMYHILMKQFVDIYHNHKMNTKCLVNLPVELNEYFLIKSFEKDKGNILFDYIKHNPLGVKVSI